MDPFLGDWCPAYEKAIDDLTKTDDYKKMENTTYADLRAQIASILKEETVDLETISNLRNGLIARVVQG